MNSIINIEVNDGIQFEIKDVNYIRESDEYENFRVSLVANIGKTKNPMKLDLTTGDAITPREIEYSYPCIFHEKNIEVLAYPVETIIAEKYESIIKRNITTTRMRDFYDLYALYNLKKNEIDMDILKTAIIRTYSRRESLETIKIANEIIEDIKNDPYLKELWNVYVSENKYIGELSFDNVVDVIKIISKKTEDL